MFPVQMNKTVGTQTSFLGKRTNWYDQKADRLSRRCFLQQTECTKADLATVGQRGQAPTNTSDRRPYIVFLPMAYDTGWQNGGFTAT